MNLSLIGTYFIFAIAICGMTIDPVTKNINNDFELYRYYS